MVLSKKFGVYTILAVVLLGSTILGFGNPVYAVVPPVALADVATTSEDIAVVISVLSNDVDPDSTITITSVSDPPNGSASITGSGTTITYTPDPNFNGVDTFTYTISSTDGTSTALVTVTVTAVNDPPVANAQSVTTNEDTSVAITLTGSDIEGSSLTFSVVTGPTSGALSGTAPNLTYTPNANFFGSDSFTFTVSDGLLVSTSAMVSITVSAVNDAPVLAPPGSKTVNEGSTLTFTASATDVDTGQILTFSLSGAPAGASITSGGVFTWTPTEAQGPGSYTFDVVVTDNGSTPLSDSETITVTVNEVNAAPTLTNPGTQTFAELSPVSIPLTASDSDIPANTLIFSATGLPSWASINSATGVITGTPGESNDGTSSVTVTVTDNGSPALSASVTFNIVITEVNVPPVANAGPDQLANEGFTVTLAGIGTDSDIPANTLTFSWTKTAGPAVTLLGATTTTPSFTAPDVSATTVLTFQLIVNDGIVNSIADTVDITVNDLPAGNIPPDLSNPGPKTVNELSTLSFTLSATDADAGQTLTYSITSGLQPGMSLNPATGAFSWTPTEAQGPGTYVVTFAVTDNGLPSLSDFESITITVNEVNVAPILAPIGPQTINELTLLTFTATATDADIPANTLTFSLGGTVPTGASITPGGLFTWTPTEAQGPGSYTFDVVVSDGSLTDSETITVTVNEVITVPISMVAETAGKASSTTTIAGVPAGTAIEVEPETPPSAELNVDVQQINIPLSNTVAPGTVVANLFFANAVPSNIGPPPDVNVLLFMDISLSAVGVNFGDENTYSTSPTITFEADKNPDGSCKELQIFIRNDETGVWGTQSTSVSPGVDIGLKCSHKATVPHFSKFAVTGGGGVGSGGGGGGGGPAHVIMDTIGPSIVTSYYEPKVPVEGEDLAITANILDDVAVVDAKLFYRKSTGDREIHQVSMKKISSTEWWRGTIPGSDVRTEVLSYWITAIDFGGNIENSATMSVKMKKAELKPEQKITSYTLQTKKQVLKPNDFIELVTGEGKNTIGTYSDTIVIKNNSNSTLESVRIMLSPEISNIFYLDRYAIKSIEPNGNVTINMELNGNPNRDMFGGLTGYKGEVMVMAEHHNPITLPVKIGAQESNYMSNYLDKVASMTKRYNRLSLLNNLLPHPSAEHKDFDLTTSSGDREITSASDSLTINNTSDKQIKNVRIIVSKLGNMFLLDKSNIKTLAPNESVTVKLVPKMDSTKYSPKDFTGEIIVIGDNGLPTVIPVRIIGEKQKDSKDEFEVRTLSSNNTITQAVDKITIRNIGNRTLDSVKILLNDNLVRIFSLNNDTFRTIAPNEEVAVKIKYNANDLKTFMQNYEGDIKIVSEHHNMRTIPVNIQWNKMESDHFVIYARNNDVAIANDVIKYLENYYQNVTSAFGTVNYKATIYMTGSTEEMQLLNDHYFYSYSNDAIFICSCENPKENALQEFIYRAMIMNYPTYYNMKKIENDNGNWLMDGMAKYMAVKNNETAYKKYIDAFKQEPTEFQWYGSPMDAQYGATITFFKYLEEKYGEDALYRSLYHLGSGIVSNTRCDAVENCAVLWGVYDSNGLDINNKKYDLDFDKIVKEWASYVVERYNISN